MENIQAFITDCMYLYSFFSSIIQQTIFIVCVSQECPSSLLYSYKEGSFFFPPTSPSIISNCCNERSDLNKCYSIQCYNPTSGAFIVIYMRQRYQRNITIYAWIYMRMFLYTYAYIHTYTHTQVENRCSTVLGSTTYQHIQDL